MSVIKSLHLLLALLLEIAMLFALAYYGFHITGSEGLRFLVGIGLPLLAIALWGLWAAPRAKRRLPFTCLIIFKLILFLGTACLLYSVGRHQWAFIFGSSAVINELLEIFFREK